jgi:uncharacterized membrane protein YhfC
MQICAPYIVTRKGSCIALCGVLFLVLAGCSAPSPASQQIAGARVTGAGLREQAAGTQSWFTVQVEQADEPIGVDFRGTLIQGSVRVQLMDAGGQVVWQEAAVTPGPFAINTVITLPVGTYDLGLAWDGPLQLQFSLQWQPGKIEVPTVSVSPVALLPGLGMSAVALGFVIYAAVRRLGWGYLGLGALGWIVTVVLKFAWAIPVNPLVYDGLTQALPPAVGSPLFDLYVGALTGVFEVGIVWLVMRYTRLGQVPFRRALAFGVGFGAFEALALGVNSLGAVLVALVAPASLPLGTLEQVARLNNVLLGLAPIVERFFTVLIHILANLLIFYAVVLRQPRWFWLSFGYKTLIDAAAAYGQVQGLNTLASLWILEGVVAVWGIVGWLGIRWVRERYPAQIASPESEPAS